MSDQAHFKNILEPRKTQCGIFRFMTRDWHPQKTYVLDKVYSPQDLKDLTASSLYLESFIDSESLRTGIQKEKLKQDVLDYLEEIGMEKKLHIIRWMGIVFLKIAFMMKIEIFVNETSILKLKSSMGNNPVLFLPTHRSYADFCLLTYLCYHYDIDFPSVAAGMDFYSMAVVGRSMRDTCAFYIRRTLAGAPLYAATLRAYVRTLVAKHCAPIEFFLEGTRSRSNKSLPPKYGMLSMSLLPLFARDVPDITIVPVNISYDRLIEHELFAYEHLGVPKPKESTGGLLKAMRWLNDHFGNVYINLGAPLSVKDYIKHNAPNIDEMLKPTDLQKVSPEQFKQVQAVADYVVTLQQQNTVATIANLVAIVLMESLMKNQALSFQEVISKVGCVVDLLRKLGVTVFVDDIASGLERILVVHSKMMILDKDKRLRLVSSPLIDVSPEVKTKMKGHTLKPESMVNALPVIQLQMYVNPVLHCLVPSALVAALAHTYNYTVLFKTCCDQFFVEQLRAKYSRIRLLLRHEYFYIDAHEQYTFQNAIKFCEENGVINIVEDKITRGTASDLQYTLSWTILPALNTLAICNEVLTEQVECTHTQALKLIQERVELSECHPYCLSLESIRNCLQGLVLTGAIIKLRSEEASYRVAPRTMEDCHKLVKSMCPTFKVNFDRSNSVILDQRLNCRL